MAGGGMQMPPPPPPDAITSMNSKAHQEPRQRGASLPFTGEQGELVLVPAQVPQPTMPTMPECQLLTLREPDAALPLPPGQAAPLGGVSPAGPGEGSQGER